MPDDIQAQVAADLGISDLPDAEQQKMIAQFGALALQASTIAVLEALPADKRDALNALLESGDEAGIKTLLDANLPNHESIARQAVAAEIERFKEFQKTL